MIITRLTGGLGNQMFQYAAGLSLAHTHRTVLKLDASWFSEASERKPHERYALSCFNISEQFATEEEIDRTRSVTLTRVERWSVILARRLHFYRYAHRLQPRGHVYHDRGFRFDPQFFAQPVDTYLHGNWQSERFFAPVAGPLRSHFSLRYQLPAALSALAARIQCDRSAFIHFRRRDYVHDPRYAREIGALGSDYYQRAVGSFRARHPEVMLYVFSDDIEAVAREFTPPGPHEFVHEPAGTEAYDVLRLMSLCNHAIIANSTLGWWGAWLGEKSGQEVIAPERWFTDGSPYDATDLVPERWERC
jgi:hypothetical protein